LSKIGQKQTIDQKLFSEFLEKAGAFERILTDSGYVKLERLSDDELAGTKDKPGYHRTIYLPVKSA